MSILDTRVIDICAVPDWEPDKVVLVITDHLEWGNKAEQGEHLLLLQEKSTPTSPSSKAVKSWRATRQLKANLPSSASLACMSCLSKASAL